MRENGATFRLAVPMIAGQLGQMMMGWADTIMVGRLGVVPLAACAFAVMAVNVFLVFGFGLISSVSIRVSRAYGAKQHQAAGETLLGGIVVALITGAIMIGLIHLAQPWLTHLGQDPEVVETGRGFLLLMGWSIMPALLMIVGKDYSEALSRPWFPFWVMIAGVGLNIVLNWFLIYGKMGAPKLGIAGAGVGTLVARWAVAIVLFTVLFRHEAYRPFRICSLPLRKLAAEVGALYRLGWPSGLHLLGEVGLFAAATLMCGWVSVTALGAHQVALTCASTAFMIPLGLAFAVTVRVGQAVGAREFHRIRPIATGAMMATAATMLCIALFFILCGGWLAGKIVDDATVISVATRLLLIAGFFALFDGVQVVGMGGLRGLADVRVPMVYVYISYWLVAVPVGYTLAFPLQWGAMGIWSGLLIGLAGISVAIVLRFLRRSRRFLEAGHPGSSSVGGGTAEVSR